MIKLFWMLSGFCVGVTTLSLALGSVPKTGRVTDDTAIYQNLSEIRVPRQKPIDFDADIAQLSKSEPRFREKLPTLSRRNEKISGAMARTSKMKYRYTEDTSNRVAQKKRLQSVRE